MTKANPPVPVANVVSAFGEEALFRPNDVVRTGGRLPVGHYRVPRYVRGKAAVVEAVIEPVAVNNEAEGFGRNAGSKRHYYRVAIALTELWPGYSGSPNDALRNEIYEDWLQRMRTMAPDEHDHDHEHEHAAILHEERAGYCEVVEIALRELLIAKGCSAPARYAVRSRCSIPVSRSWRQHRGAGLVDPAFHARLLADGRGACEELGVTFYDDTGLIVLENTDKVHNLIACTLCSCYPRPVLGLPPDWHKLNPYRARAVVEPRALLAEFGTIIPDEVEVRVRDSTAQMRYLLLPMRPRGTEDFSEGALAALVTRDAMICVVPVTLPAN